MRAHCRHTSEVFPLWAISRGLWHVSVFKDFLWSLWNAYKKAPISFIITKELAGLRKICSFFAILSVKVIESTLKYPEGQTRGRFRSTFPAWMWEARAAMPFSYPGPSMVLA